MRIFSQVLIPGVVGPWIGERVLANADKIVNNDGTESFIPNANIFLAALVPIVILSLGLFIGNLTGLTKKKPRTTELSTPFSERKEDWSVYPRPQLKRDSYMSLCGKWDLAVKYDSESTEALGEIEVPFAPESALSGIKRTLRAGEMYAYEKRFTLPEDFDKKTVLLHFGAVDQIAYVYLNDRFVGKHEGGYLPFEFDITPYLSKGENKLTVEVEDTLDIELACGKQTHKRGGMWYTATSGIWQAVWLEAVPENYISALRFTPDLRGVLLEVSGGADKKSVKISTPSGELALDFEGESVRIDIPEPLLWTPEKLEFKLDGVTYHTIDITGSAEYSDVKNGGSVTASNAAFHDYFYLIMYGGVNTELVTENSNLPTDYAIDYVRLYQNADGEINFGN